MIEHYLQLDGANVVNTPDFALALENMRYVRRRHAISLFFGDPGVGKTIAAQAIADSFGRGGGLRRQAHARSPIRGCSPTRFSSG